MYRIIIAVMALICVSAAAVFGESAAELVAQANELYESGRYVDAVELYNRAMAEAPGAAEPKFDKANALYRLDDFSGAAELLRKVAAETRDIQLAASAAYNLGNCCFRMGQRQQDSDFEKALGHYQDAIRSWRRVLDIQPENASAAGNIEVARLVIKDILDRLKRQNEEQAAQEGDKQQDDKQQPKEEDSDGKQPEQQGADDQDQGDQEGPEEKQQQENQQGEQRQDDSAAEQSRRQDQAQAEAESPDVTADEILKNEEDRRKQKQLLRRGGYRYVEKDW